MGPLFEPPLDAWHVVGVHRGLLNRIEAAAPHAPPQGPVAWKISCGHKYLRERTVPRKQLRQAPSRSASAAGLVPATSSRNSKEVQLGWPETSGSQNQLSRGVDVQAPPPKGDKSISHNGQGQALYLQAQHRLKPEEKFQCPVMSSWEYDWHVEFTAGLKSIEEQQEEFLQMIDLLPPAIGERM
ncbi:hypothetical protein P7K49_030926 [Saguinus oedipus]|uniref:Sperm microtubule inner protein 1 C-terminal domain-containing protein n=1 Tax=Saguinus oedipus TaxID=9490 RepID=A0ABQ9U5K8_SAGOE|nr:hypothetical protein P7K49_030926 [Saguinus oedipus]